jgi:hypothetical protein
VTVLLQGVVGSTAYGLAHAGSDVDRLGVFAAPTQAFHGLHAPTQTRTTTNPDGTWHEAGKYARLALACNPTALELLWLDTHEIRTPLGADLIALRNGFLSARRVRDAYLGYATQQFRKLEARGDGTFSSDVRRRTAKHARHLARLTIQGVGLWRTGRLGIRLTDPQRVTDFGEQVAAGNLDVAKQALAQAEATFDVDRTPLPDRPNEAAVERWLLAVRTVALVESSHPALSPVPAAQPYVPPPGAPPAVLVDLDGTAAIMCDRSPYDETRVGEDSPNAPVLTAVRAMHAAGHVVVFCSGRTDGCRDATAKWLATHAQVPYAALLMRAAGDSRPDAVVKRELFDAHVRDRYAVVAVFDDRNSVVEMWRALGLTVFQVAPGAF